MAVRNIIGRRREIAILDSAWASGEAEFIAVYGRRRVGKTHLIRHYFSDKGIYLEVTGIKNVSLKMQLENFMKIFSETFFGGAKFITPKSWDEAFHLIRTEMEKRGKEEKIVLFLDELPWMATKKSGLIQALEYHWNRYLSRIPNLVLVVCGSAASWMLDNLVFAKGGLYNRLTKRIKLDPFNLYETEEFLRYRGIKLNPKQVLDLYMVLGGIPYYLKEVEKGQTAAQIIDTLCFQKNGLLQVEFKHLFTAQFDQAEANLAIIKAIASYRRGISRKELTEKTGISSGGTLNQRLNELESSGFIQSYIPYGHQKRDHYFRVIDEYTLFYLKLIEPLMLTSPEQDLVRQWESLQQTTEALDWTGYAFEATCMKHISQIRKSLGLDKVACHVGTWRLIPIKGSSRSGAQVDLLFDPHDGAITLCEIKFSDHPYTIDKDFGKKLLNKIDLFEKQLKTKKEILLAMITTTGLKKNLWSEEIVHIDLNLDALFQN